MSEEEKERECRKAIEIITKNPDLWESLKKSLEGEDFPELSFENSSLGKSVKDLKIPFLEKAILMGLRDANYLMNLKEDERNKIPILTKFSY